jgi:ABC-type transport system involved in cytochrome c biogenesis permease subunit
MISWDIFSLFAIPAIVCWCVGALTALMGWHKARPVAACCTGVGLLIMAAFIGGLWYSLSRPPLRTMGETRLWYSFFIALAGLLTYLRWRYRWIMSLTAVMATVFCIVNMAHPELHDKSMMPALQSGWFVPHVTVYMFSYALMGCSCLLAIVALFRPKEQFLESADRLVYIGFGLLMLGILSGAVWAKEAWGTFWSWDPKETWAAVTFASYLLYIHMRLFRRGTVRQQALILIFSFLTLQMCWYGISFLPAAQNSFHVYGAVN